MFDISVWLTENLISSVARGVFARECVAIMATDYMLRGVLTAGAGGANRHRNDPGAGRRDRATGKRGND